MKTLLLVDDSPTMIIQERMLLGGMGYRLITASNGLEALTKATAEHPDLIVMDVMMPKLDGIETCKRLRAQPETKDIPVIIVTTRSEQENIKRAFEAGCTDYVTKPLDGAELMQKIRSRLDE